VPIPPAAPHGASRPSGRPWHRLRSPRASKDRSRHLPAPSPARGWNRLIRGARAAEDVLTAVSARRRPQTRSRSRLSCTITTRCLPFAALAARNTWSALLGVQLGLAAPWQCAVMHRRRAHRRLDGLSTAVWHAAGVTRPRIEGGGALRTSHMRVWSSALIGSRLRATSFVRARPLFVYLCALERVYDNRVSRLRLLACVRCRHNNDNMIM